MKAFVKNIGDYVIHNAPKGIRYWKIANGSNMNQSELISFLQNYKSCRRIFSDNFLLSI